MNRTHLRDRDELVLGARELEAVSVARLVVDAAREKFIAYDFRETLVDGERLADEADDVVLVTILSAGHENLPRVLAETLEARYEIDVARDGRELRVAKADLDVDDEAAERGVAI